MVKISSFKRGAKLTHYALGSNYNAVFEMWLGRDANALQSRYVKGEIHTYYDRSTGFNDCLHLEGYGELFLPTKCTNGDTVVPGFRDLTPDHLSDDTESYSVLYARTDLLTCYSISENEEAAISNSSYQLLFANLTVWKDGTPRPKATTYCICRNFKLGTYYYASRSFNSAEEARRWALSRDVIQSLHQWHPWSSDTYTVDKTAEVDEYYDEVSSRVFGLKGYMIEESERLLRQEQADGFRTALCNNRTVPTLSICCQILADGLVVQAMADIYNECSRVLSQSAKVLKSMSKKKLDGYRQVRDLSQRTIGMITKGDLAYQWGVKAPLRDYKQLVEALANPNWHPYFDGSTVARKTFQSGEASPMEHSLVFGVCYDYFKGSSVEDVMAILHQGGFDLTARELWDLIPFSFAVNWVFNTEKLLGDLEASMEIWRYPIKYFWKTDRCTVTETFHGQPVEVTLYTRKKVPFSTVQSLISVTSEDLFFDEDYRGTFSLRNVKEAACLIYQLLT